MGRESAAFKIAAIPEKGSTRHVRRRLLSLRRPVRREIRPLAHTKVGDNQLMVSVLRPKPPVPIFRSRRSSSDRCSPNSQCTS